ncbi:MAG TPA: HD domain-containing phosphohydrolase [Patescibacteria group bacterium]|nr:HD domain-containing phosphohydrolase [Patescibacteria group bacterium]
MHCGKVNSSGYQHFIDNMHDGLVYLEGMVNDSTNAIDYLILEGNMSFELLIGMKIEKILGKRLTEISSDGKIAGFDLIDICSKVGPMEDKAKFEHYSANLKKWYVISCYKSEKNCFCVVFHDITESKNRAEKINTLYQSAVKFHETSYLDIDYQWIADELLKLSGATFVLVNVFDKEAMKTVTRGFSGLSHKVHQVVKILGYNIIGKAWNVSEADQAVMKSNKLVRMGRLREFNFNRIAPFVVSSMEKISNLGDSYGIGITYNEEILGSFIIMMQEGRNIESPDIVELFVNQLGITLLKKKADEDVKKIDQEYQTMFNGSQDAMFLINVNNDNSFAYHMVNKGYELDVGVSAESVDGLTPKGLYGETIGNQIEGHYIDCIAAKKPIIYEEAFTLLGKKKVWHTLLSPILEEDRVVQIVGSSRNITELKEWEDEVSRERQLFKVTLHSIGDAVITTDTENRIVILNKAAEVLTGWNQEDARGKFLNEVMITAHEKRYDLFQYTLNEVQIDGNQHMDCKILISRNGNKRIISSSEAFIRDESDNILGVVIVFRDVTLEKQKEEEVRYLGYHDKLTGLYNRAYFEEALMRFDSESFMPLGLIMADSNGLKMVNDVFGHEEGDKLLIMIAEIFKSICSNEDIVARVGGDEFAVILPRVSPERANHIISSIKQMCNFGTSDPISPSVALGLAIKTDSNEDIRKIYKLAEDRMYNNKLVESKSIRSSIISSLKKTLEERTHETEAHAQRLKELSMEIGKIMDLYDSELDELSLLAMLHDIGKIAIPDYILGKPAKLTEDEWKIMKSHCEIGYRIAVASPELAHIANLILSHHERWDGTGYPQELKGEEIPLLSRIIAVVDAYDAMTSDRPYHAAISSEAALEELGRCSGTQFDPYIVKKFIEVISNTK